MASPRNHKDCISQQELKKLLNYDPKTGLFTRISVIGSSNQKIGDLTGRSLSSGYLRIYLKGKRYKAHRLAWLYMKGVWPKRQIDHKNHIRDDNRWCNLYEATNQENCKNRSLPKNNKSGVIGVCWITTNKAWAADITENKQTIRLGLFTDKFEAICARLSANNKYGFHENHGQMKR